MPKIKETDRGEKKVPNWSPSSQMQIVRLPEKNGRGSLRAALRRNRGNLGLGIFFGVGTREEGTIGVDPRETEIHTRSSL